MKMRELEDKTGVGREAIRFYIREGMLPEPEKPKRNVADYSEQYVTRIKLIKELQEKRFLPLKLVKAVLDSSDSRELVGAESVPGIEHFLPALLDSTPAENKTLAEVIQSSGFSEAQIRGFAAINAITIGADQTLDFRDAAIVEAWGRANAAGFDLEHGYGPEFLGTYVAAMEQLAVFEVDRFMKQIGADLSGSEAAAIGAEGVNQANRLLTLLHTKFVLKTLSDRAKESPAWQNIP